MKATATALLLLLAFSAPPAASLVTGTASGTDTQTAPTPASEDPGWANMGNFADIGSGQMLNAVYLGNGWVISPTHIMPSLFLDGTATGGSAVITGISSTASVIVGSKVTGKYIPENTTVSTKDSSTQLTLSAPCYAPGYGITGVTRMWFSPPIGNAFDVMLGGTRYYWDTVPAIPLNVDGQPETFRMWKISSPPVLPTLEIAPVILPIGTTVVMIGFNDERTTPISGAYTGWNTALPKRKIWGKNIISSNNLPYSQSTTFDSGLPTAQEVQATMQDSGGGVFARVGGVWALYGIIDTANFINGNSSSAVYGDTTGFSPMAGDLRNQIMTIMKRGSQATRFIRK